MGWSAEQCGRPLPNLYLAMLVADTWHFTHTTPAIAYAHTHTYCWGIYSVLCAIVGLMRGFTDSFHKVLWQAYHHWGDWNLTYTKSCDQLLPNHPYCSRCGGSCQTMLIAEFLYHDQLIKSLQKTSMHMKWHVWTLCGCDFFIYFNDPWHFWHGRYSNMHTGV